MPTITYPADAPEPVTVEQARLAARIDTDALDGEIAGLITAAREQAEHITGRVYRGQVVRIERITWPGSNEELPVHSATACAATWFDGAAWQQLAPAPRVGHAVASGLACVLPAAGTAWPALGEAAPGGARVRLDLTAEPPAQIPEQVRTYIKAQVAAWIKTPEALAGASLAANPLLARLLDRERTWS